MKRVIFSGFLLLLLISFFIISFKLYRLQVAKTIDLKLDQKIQKISPLRGNIYLKDKDGNLFPVALSYYSYDLYFYPPKSKNISEELKKIDSIITLSNLENLIDKAKSSKNSFILIKDIEEEKKKLLEKLNFDSIFFEEKIKRVYPQENLLSTVIGFAKFNQETGLLEGKYGLEKYYNEILKGEVGYLKETGIIKAPKKGGDLILNIDYYVQRKIEEILKAKVEEYKAEGGLIIVAETKTGNIIGLAELPNYNPNKFNEVKDYSVFVSRISKTYEPGSVVKPFFYAAAFEENLAVPETKYEDKGYVVLNNWVIKNFDGKGRGVIDLKTALEQSLNTGSVYISQILGKTRFLKYVEKFRLNKKAEIDFPILEEPDFRNLVDPGREVNFGTASFGQGISLSPLNLVQSFLVFANQGRIMKLNFVKEIDYIDGSKREINSQIIADKILNQKTLEEILPILEGVVENQAKKAKIRGYGIGGKTGSALIPSIKETPENPTGYSDEAITTFVGFFPISNPQFIILVRLDKPAKGLLAFGTAAPTFRLVAEFLINYYNIEPDRIQEVINF